MITERKTSPYKRAFLRGYPRYLPQETGTGWKQLLEVAWSSEHCLIFLNTGNS